MSDSLELYDETDDRGHLWAFDDDEAGEGHVMLNVSEGARGWGGIVLSPAHVRELHAWLSQRVDADAAIKGER